MKEVSFLMFNSSESVQSLDNSTEWNPIVTYNNYFTVIVTVQFAIQ